MHIIFIICVNPICFFRLHRRVATRNRLVGIVDNDVGAQLVIIGTRSPAGEADPQLLVVLDIKIHVEARESHRRAARRFDFAGHAWDGRERTGPIGNFFNSNTANDAAPIELAVGHQVTGQNALADIVMVGRYRRKTLD